MVGQLGVEGLYTVGEIMEGVVPSVVVDMVVVVVVMWWQTVQS